MHTSSSSSSFSLLRSCTISAAYLSNWVLLLMKDTSVYKYLIPPGVCTRHYLWEDGMLFGGGGVADGTSGKSTNASIQSRTRGT